MPHLDGRSVRQVLESSIGSDRGLNLDCVYELVQRAESLVALSRSVVWVSVGSWIVLWIILDEREKLAALLQSRSGVLAVVVITIIIGI